MCRNIRVLHNFVPPTTQEEIRAAALQFVRKVSGVQKPSHADDPVFEQAIAEIASTTPMESRLMSIDALKLARMPVTTIASLSGSAVEAAAGGGGTSELSGWPAAGAVSWAKAVPGTAAIANAETPTKKCKGERVAVRRIDISPPQESARSPFTPKLRTFTFVALRPVCQAPGGAGRSYPARFGGSFGGISLGGPSKAGEFSTFVKWVHQSFDDMFPA
jgi:hypothetical protein